MSSLATKIVQLDQIKQDLLKSCEGTHFDVHIHAPSHWNNELDEKLGVFLAEQPVFHYSTCPICGHKNKSPMFSSEFNDPWWIYPQRVFQEMDTCAHFELMTFSILWTRSEPLGSKWNIPCGWGVPALTESLAQNENLVLTVKSSELPNGATIFWITFYRSQPGLPLFSDFWALPVLKSRTTIRPSLNSRGYWAEFAPLTIHSPAVWSKLYIENSDGSIMNYETKKDTGAWLQRIRNWAQMAYTQPLKMNEDRFISESGFASFAIGMRTSRTKGALFISQTPVFVNHESFLKFNSSSPVTIDPHFQSISRERLSDIAATNTLWALVDPFQNESIQDWLRLVKKQTDHEVQALWNQSSIGQNWSLTLDSAHPSSFKINEVSDFYRDLSPVIIKVTPDILELSYRYNLGNQSWGAFFISHHPREQIHCFLRRNLICNLNSNWVYFRFYESNFLTMALSTLKNNDLAFFYGPISAWIVRNQNENQYSLLTTTGRDKNFWSDSEIHSSYLPKLIHETAQRAFQVDLPRRIKEFIRDRTPEFSELIPVPVMNRWIRESVRQANQYGIRKEPHLIKFFLWKVLITPTWCHLSPFVRILQQPVAEEIKVQNIENLFPQLRLTEIPRGLTIESWDAELWVELRKFHSPLGNADPEAFNPLLGDKPPAMPLHNPNWLKALGQFYETAYADLHSHSGTKLLDSTFHQELERPTAAPPRIISISNNDIVIRDESHRSLHWLKEHGFEMLASTQGNWILRSSTFKQILLASRQFLEAFPYVESRYLFDFLNLDDKETLTNGLEIYTLYWDSHHFWYLNRI